MKPKVSIVIPTYNKPFLLAQRAIPSVLNQTYRNLECIVVDDGSTDNTPGIIKNFQMKDNRIRFFRFSQNRGAATATNHGIKKAKGDFIAILEHDDEYKPRFVEATLKKLNNLSREYGAVGCKVLVVYENSIEEIGTPSLKSSFYIALSSGWLFRREVFAKSRLFYDETISSDGDTDLGIRFFEIYKVDILDEILFVRHVRKNIFDKNGLSSITKKRIQELKRFLEKNLSKIEKKGEIKETAHLYRRAGMTFMLGGHKSEGISFLWRAFKTMPTIRNFMNLFAAFCGTLTYRYYFYFEKYSYIQLQRFKKYLRMPHL